MAKRKSIIPGFSWNRALGITSAKQKIARATGIPTTKQGRKRKLQSSLWTAVAAGVAAACTQNKQAVPPSPSAEVKPIPVRETQPRPTFADHEELLIAAIETVLDAGEASASILQRKLKIGYSSAAKLMDEMYGIGVIGEFEGDKPRKVLITREQFEDGLTYEDDADS